MIFLDSNVPIYAADCTDAKKQRVARAILAKAVHYDGFIISSQVLNEFANVVLKKLRRTEDEVRGFISVLRRIHTVDLAADWTERALSIKAKYGIQFYDALIVVAAEASNCAEIYSEDLNDGQLYRGIKATNPFKSK